MFIRNRITYVHERNVIEELKFRERAINIC